MKKGPYQTNLREIIADNGYTFKEVAEETGISLGSLFIYARGERPIPHEKRYKIAHTIGCSVTDIVSVKQSLQKEKKGIIVDELLLKIKEDFTQRWELHYTIGVKYAHLGLDTKLQSLEQIAQQSTDSQNIIQIMTLLTLGYQLKSCILRDLMYYQQAHIAYQKAFDLAHSLENQELMVSALAREGITLIQQEKPKEAIIYLTGALNILDDIAPSIIRGYIFQGLSEAHAKTGNVNESQHAIEQAEAYQTNQVHVQAHSLIRGVTISSIAAQKGINAVLLSQYRQAITFIDKSLETYDHSLTRGYARLLAQKAEAFKGLGTVDACVQCAQEALSLAQSAGSQKTTARVQSLHKQLQQSPWRKEPNVIQLGIALMESK